MTSTAQPRTAQTGDERSVGELVDVATIQMSRLVRDEMLLARLEMQEKAGSAAKGAGLAGAGGLLMFYGGAALLVAAGSALALVLPDWAAALLVGAALIVLGAVLTFAGKKVVTANTPPVPAEAVAGARTDIEAVTRRSQR
ncbi:phage holin family protein [Nocardia carnea]|uniref:phage holin family protein n=1 Tax=Nocardia carnea TaxID=37328 RepID=UPI0024539A11|nr:phage holin family protein [Nocardia carnea]